MIENDSPSDDHHDIKSNLYDKSESRDCSDANCDSKIDIDNESSGQSFIESDREGDDHDHMKSIRERINY